MVGRQTPRARAGCLCGGERLRTWLARASLLTSSRKWEGNGVSHNARRGETDSRRGSAHPYSDITEMAGVNVMRHLQPIKCMCPSLSLHRPTGGRKPIFVTGLYAGH